MPICWKLIFLSVCMCISAEQVKYVVELARALGSMPGVYRVDLLTRQVSAPDVDWSYGEPTEMLSPRDTDDFGDDMGESSGSYIVRIPFGDHWKILIALCILKLKH